MITPEIAKLIEEGQKGGGGRRLKRRRPALPAGPKLTPAARQAMNGLARRLATATPEQRQQVVAAVRARSGPAELAVVVDFLLKALLRARSADARAGLAAALSAIGPPAAAAVRLELLKVKTGWQQAALAGVLEAVGPTLPAGEQIGMFLMMSGRIGTVAEDAVTAVARAAAAIRLSMESPPIQ